MAQAAAQKYGIDPNVFLRQINQESGFNPNARSSAGALGIAQFMPATARAMGVNPMDPASALDGAARLMAQSLRKYGSYESALSVYNSGRPDAYKDPNFAGGQTYNYVRSILRGHSSPSQPRLGKVEGSTQGENQGLLTALGQLAAYEGAPVEINSGYRSYQKQAQLYANRANNPNPVAKPGTSLHERGLAADGTVNGIPLGKLPASILSRYGLSSVPGDPVHVQLSGRPASGSSYTGGGSGDGGGMLSPQPVDHRQHIVAQKVDLFGKSLAAELLSQTATLSSGGAPNLKNLFTLAKGYQGARKQAPLGGTNLAQEAGKYQAQVQSL